MTATVIPFRLGRRGHVQARCPYCDWTHIYSDWHEACIGGLRHANQCEKA